MLKLLTVISSFISSTYSSYLSFPGKSLRWNGLLLAIFLKRFNKSSVQLTFIKEWNCSHHIQTNLYLNISKSALGKRLANSSTISSTKAPYGLYPSLADWRIRLYLEFNSSSTALAASEKAVFSLRLYREIFHSPETQKYLNALQIDITGTYNSTVFGLTFKWC